MPQNEERKTKGFSTSCPLELGDNVVEVDVEIDYVYRETLGANRESRFPPGYSKSIFRCSRTSKCELRSRGRHIIQCPLYRDAEGFIPLDEWNED